MHVSAIGCKILALKSNAFIVKELVTSKNEMCKELFLLLKYVAVDLILQLEVVLLLLTLLLLLLLLLLKFVNEIKGRVFIISLSKK